MPARELVVKVFDIKKTHKDNSILSVFLSVLAKFMRHYEEVGLKKSIKNSLM